MKLFSGVVHFYLLLMLHYHIISGLELEPDLNINKSAEPNISNLSSHPTLITENNYFTENVVNYQIENIYMKLFNSLRNSGVVVSESSTLTTCRLRPINWWNYTKGEIIHIDGSELDAYIGGNPHLVPDFWNINLSLSSTPPSVGPLANATPRVDKVDMPFISHTPCAVLFIYAPWCPFSAMSAPAVNALSRAFPQLPVLAIHVDDYLKFRWSLRVFYTPKIKLFFGGHAYREYNGSDADLHGLIDFIWNTIRILPAGPVGLHPADFEGPLHFELTKNNQRLVAAWIVFLICIAYILFVTNIVRHFVTLFVASIETLKRILSHISQPRDLMLHDS